MAATCTRYTRPARLLPPPLVARVGARLAEALAYAHRRGVVHRDVKPANVLVDWTKDIVKLSDFGLARSTEHTQTRSGIALGSPDYMAPEQLAGGAVGPASDVYGLGATLFELLTGRRPHQADNLGELLRAVASEPAPTAGSAAGPSWIRALCDAVMALLAKDLSQRPSDAAQVADAPVERGERHAWRPRAPLDPAPSGAAWHAGSEAQSARPNATDSALARACLPPP